MIETKATKYDLEERTYNFAKDIRTFVKTLHINHINSDDIKQLIRASGSVGANYIEANDSLSKKDFTMRIKICRKEAKECIYWLNLLQEKNSNLIKEAQEITNIFGAIVRKLEQSSLKN